MEVGRWRGMSWKHMLGVGGVGSTVGAWRLSGRFDSSHLEPAYLVPTNVCDPHFCPHTLCVHKRPHAGRPHLMPTSTHRAQLVEMKDAHVHSSMSGKSYAELYRDLRTAVDMCHRDGSLKKAVTAHPEEFIHHVSVGICEAGRDRTRCERQLSRKEKGIDARWSGERE
eukprot:30354-Chlamydomonas_euryale.AAC.1